MPLRNVELREWKIKLSEGISLMTSGCASQNKRVQTPEETSRKLRSGTKKSPKIIWLKTGSQNDP